MLKVSFYKPNGQINHYTLNDKYKPLFNFQWAKLFREDWHKLRTSFYQEMPKDTWDCLYFTNAEGVEMTIETIFGVDLIVFNKVDNERELIEKLRRRVRK